jgi:DNA replication protein DnaC
VPSICDELGFVRLDPDQSQLLFTLLAHRYTRGALIITSNLEFADWTTVFAGDERLTAASVDVTETAASSPSGSIPSFLVRRGDSGTSRGS